jgi:hypothetical protein
MVLWKKTSSGQGDPPKKRTILGQDIDKYGYLLPPTEIIGAKDKTTDYVLNQLVRTSPDNQTPYKIWKMSGTPNIRLGSNISYTTNLNYNNGKQRASYNPVNNTINIPDTVKDEDIIERYRKFQKTYAEFPHSYQFNADKLGSIKQGIKDWINHPYFSQKEYDKHQYDQKGSLEYEAHKKIEPQINIMSETGNLFNPVRGDSFTTLYNPLLRDGMEPKNIADLILTPLREISSDWNKYHVIRALKNRAKIPSSINTEKDFNFNKYRKMYGFEII